MAKNKESNLLTAMVGSINSKEEASKIQVNCRPEDPKAKGNTQTGLETVELTVLFPDITAQQVVPLNGGAIVKLDLTAGSEVDWKESGELVGQYGEPIGRLAEYVKKEIPHVSTDKPKDGEEPSFVSVSNLAKARVAVNRALGDMPQLSSAWHKAGVPTLVLSKTRTTKYKDTAALQKAMDEDKKVRISDLNRPIGYFKFIPPQVLSQVFDALMNKPADDKTPEEYGMWNGAYYGISGESFYKMSVELQAMIKGGDWKEDFIVKTLLDLFPVFKIKSSDITGGVNTLPVIGYYTAHKKSLYIKMPDLSGRDSNGDSQNIYGLGSDVEGGIRFCFELVKDVYKYAGKAFDFLPPPVLTPLERDVAYPPLTEEGVPPESNPKITISKKGIDKDLYKKYKYFLSPILPAGSSTSAGGLKTTPNGVEIFTAPVLTMPYLDKDKGKPVVSYPPKVVSKLIYEFSKKMQTGGLTGYNAVFNDTTDVGKKESEAARDKGELTHLEFADKRKKPSDKHKYKFEELGIPLSEPLTSIGIDSVVDVLGEANRPELLLGFRDGWAPEQLNESKIYDSKIYGAKTLLASIRPNIVTDLVELSQIPANWIPLAIKGDDKEDFYTLEIPYDKPEEKGPKSSLNIYNSMGLLTFALYAVDHMGQIVRAPGKNIRITPLTPNLSIIGPNGFQGSEVITLAHKLAPTSLLSIEENVLTGLTLCGEGFVGMQKELKVNFYSDEKGEKLLTSVQHGQKFGAGQNELRVRDIDEECISIEMNGAFSDILPALTGTFYVAVQLPGGNTSKTVPFLISKAGTKAPDLPPADPTKIKFKDSFGVEVEGFGKIVHSIPVIQDAVNHASISLRTEATTFDHPNAKAKLYAYIAVLANDHNKEILLTDVGWLNDDGHKEGSVLKKTIVTALSEDTEFYIPTGIEWTLGSGDFKRNHGRKATLRFPGTDHTNVNMSRFTEFSAKGSREYPAYILLSNSQLSGGANIPMFDSTTGGSAAKPIYDYAVVPIGSPGHPGAGVASDSESAFAAVPEVLGFVAELPSDTSGSRIVSNIPKASLLSSTALVKEIGKEKIESLKTGAEQTLSIISSNALDQLSIVFKGSLVPRMEEVHQASIGSQSLDNNCTSVVYVGDNRVVANYSGITGIASEGWTDIVVKKTDERFKCSYNSVIYNKVTTHITPGDDEDTFLDEDGKLLAGKDLIISQFNGDEGDSSDLTHKFQSHFHDEKGAPVAVNSLSSVIFPGGNGDFSPLPLRKTSSFIYPPPEPGLAKDNSYYEFTNPIKVRPSLDIILGATRGLGEALLIRGCTLTDSPVDEKTGLPKDEIIAINRFGKTSVAMGLMDMADAIKKSAEEAAATLANIKKSIAEMDDEAAKATAQKNLEKAEAEYNETNEKAEKAVESAQTAQAKQDAAKQQAMDAAMAGSQGGDSGSATDALNDGIKGFAEGAAALKDAAGEALGAINDALGLLNVVNDALSSIANIANQIAAGVEGAVSALGSRPDDFVKANLKYIYVDKDNVINSSAWMKRDDKKQFKLTTSYEFSQTAAIKFNTPEIVMITKNEVEYLPFGSNPFAKLHIQTGDKLKIQVIGANRDTKFEFAGKRVEAKQGTPASIGVFQNFEVEVPDMSSFSIFGTGDCITILATNSNENRMKLGRQLGNVITLDLETENSLSIFDQRNKGGPGKDLAEFMEDNAYLKFLMVKLGKVAGGAKESLQSFCDFSFHLTAELSLQLRNFRVLLVPIKIIFCIIDVICALLNPWRLAFAIIRLFLCLYDLILLLPQLAVPAMFLALLIHVLNLLLCVILKILSWVNAINEIITALVTAIEHKNYPAIAALEEALNEHLFSLETDISVLEPIMTILDLFLQLLQLAFAFPCKVGANDDAEACIDPSMMAGLILGKVAPTGAIAPNVLLPLAQAYTRLPPEDSGYYGNSPPNPRDNSGNIGVSGPLKEYITGGAPSGQIRPFDVVVRPQDERNSIVAKKTTDAGSGIPNMMNMATGEMKTIQEEGWFQKDGDGDGRLDNIDYPKLRTQVGGPVYEDSPDNFRTALNNTYYGANDGYFDATFSLSYTKGTKDWGFFTGPDPRLVRFNFDSGGVTNDIAWWTWWLIFPIFWSKKRVGTMQTIDSRPMFMRKNDDGDAVVSASRKDFVSPIDGFDSFLKKVGSGYQPKPLTVTFELNEPGINMDTFDAEFTPKTVTKTFGNIPMIAVVDDEFNVYFVEKYEGNGGIEMSGNSIDSIHLKMLNKPSAPKHKTSRQKEMAFSNESWNSFNSFKAETAAFLGCENVPEGTSGIGTGYDWSENTSSKHKVSGYPTHYHLAKHPITKEQLSSKNFYTTDGPNVNEVGALDPEGRPEWYKDTNKYGATRTGEAIMHSTANAMWLKGETIDNDAAMYYNGTLVSEILGGLGFYQRNPDQSFTAIPARATGDTNSPSGATTIDYLLSTASQYRYNKALQCFWGHEEFGYQGEVGLGPTEAGIKGAGGNIPWNDETQNPNSINYGDYPEKRIQTLKNKVVTFFLSTEQEGSSPYDNLNADFGDDDDDDWGDPYWPVNYGSMGDKLRTDSGPAGGFGGSGGGQGGDKGRIDVYILEKKDMYNHPEYQNTTPGSEDELNLDNPDRFEVEWTPEMDQNIPYPKLGMAYDHGGGSSWEQGDIGNSITSVKVYDFPQFYIVDMRQMADEIAAACGAAGPAEMLMDLPGFEEPFEDNVQEMMDCMKEFLDHFNSEEEDDEGVPKGMIPQIRHKLGKGILPGKVSVADVVGKYESLVECVNDQIDKSCHFVVNPLNTGFKLLGDEDETPLPDYIDPEQADPGALGEAGIVDELEFDSELAGFPAITGAMEYASGIGDMIIAEVESKALIELLPRDCYDDPMPKALDLTEKIEIDFVTDQAGSAELVTPFDDSTALIVKDEEKYTAAVTANTPGKVVIKGSICGVIIQAVTDKGIVSGLESATALAEEESAESLEGCIEDAMNDGLGEASDTEDDTFAPGSLMKVDRLLTILFVPKGAAGAGGGGMGGPGGLYGDGDRDASARSAKPSPQTSGTKLEN